MRYKKRNPDGTFGNWVFTPGEDSSLSPELTAAFEAIAGQFQLIQYQQEQLALLKAEVEALKGVNS